LSYTSAINHVKIMRNLTKRQLAGASFSVLLILTLVLYPLYKSWQYNRDLHAGQRQIAETYAKWDVMQPSSKYKIDEIVAEVQKTGGISDSNLEWTLAFLRKNDGAGLSQHLARSSILSPLEELKRISPPQKEKIYQAVIPMLGNNPAYDDDLDKIRASAVMRILRDKRATPYLTALLAAPDHTDGEEIHLHAQAALDAIGYKDQ